MQGQRGAMGSFQETLGSSDGDRGSDYNESDLLFLESRNQERQGLSMWTVGESGSSSRSNQVSHGPIEPRPDRGWPGLMKSYPEPPASMLQLGDHSSLVPHNVTVNPSTSIGGFRPSNPSESSSFSGPFGPASVDPFEMDNRRLSRKRKAVELSIGQSSSSGIGSSNVLGIPEGGSDDRIIPRLGLGVSGLSSENPIAENNRRNVQLRISSSRQQDPLPASNNNNNNNNRQSDISALYPSLRLNPVDFTSLPLPATAENSNSSSQRSQPGLRIPALRRNVPSNSRWTRSSSSRTNRSSNLVIPVERNEVDSRAIPSNISDHPLFSQSNEINWSSNGGGGGTVSNGGNVVAAAASSQAAPVPLSAPPSSSSAHRNPSHYHPRRLSAYLRRSLLSATDLEGAGGQNGNLFARIPPSASSSSTSQDLGIPPAAVSVQNHHLQQAQLRMSSVLAAGRQLEGTFGIPYLSSRSMTGGSEGRGRLVSEIRNVLDLMRRGEPLRFEDLMILDQSVFYGIADVHDRHRDMRLDIDNMSYEELLALEERIGNVNTGLTEEKISMHLKQKRYVAVRGQPDAVPCCVCQEEYKNGDDVGTLECGHEFHHGCIKQWLQHKNSCPICKSTGFGAS